MGKEIIYRGHYINGRFQLFTKKKSAKKTAEKTKGKPEGKIERKTKGGGKAAYCSYSPADLEDLILKKPDEEATPPLDLVFEKGKQAWLSWSHLPLKARIKKLRPIKRILKARAKELAQTISRETGKPLWESRQETAALLGKTDFVLGEGLKRIEEESPAPSARLRFKSRGLLAILGPFNFPLHLPYGQILPALVAGNAVVFKPSEKTQASGQKLAEIFAELGLLPGLFQMLQGGGKLGMQIAGAKAVDGLLFTGSFKVGQKIKEKLIKDHHKILALEMGGLNSSLIWEDADLDHAVSETLKSCFQTAGQRCSSTAQILVHKKIAKKFIEGFVEGAKKLSIDHWSKDPFMGPVIDSLAVKRFLAVRQEVKRRGGKALLNGGKLSSLNGYYVRPEIYKMEFHKSSFLSLEERFSPQAIIYELDDLNTALDWINYSGYGLVLSVFTQRKRLKEELFHRAKVGLLNWNLSTIGASPFLPFGGLGKSGNDRPAGAFAFDFCASPLAERWQLK